MNLIKNKKALVSITVALAVIIFLGSAFKAPSARADFFKDLWGSITKPFSNSGDDNSELPSANGEVVKSNNESNKETSLYKPALDYEQAVIAAVKKASPAVVSITVSKNVAIIENCPFNPFPDLPREFQQFFGDDFFGFSQPCEKGTELREIGGGSGFIVAEDGLIVTNRHVVSDTAASYTVFTNDGKKYSAKVLARDSAQDLAVLEIDARGLKVLTLGDSSSIELGQSVIAIGNALGEFRNTVSVGVISGLSREITASDGRRAETISGVIQTDAAINPGNSGGPLLNLRGEVIGINTAIVSGAQNIGFAIPINKAKRDISSVKTTGEIQTPYLGVRYMLVTEELAKKERLLADYGALIRGNEEGPGVESGSPADKAGILAEDIILEVNGKKIGDDNGLGEIISELQVGQSASFKINRKGKILNITVKLGKRPMQ